MPISIIGTRAILFFSFDTNNKMHCNYITKPLKSIFNGDSKQDFLQTKFVESFCRYILAIDDTFCLILLHLNEVEPHFGPLPSFSPSIHLSIQPIRPLPPAFRCESPSAATLDLDTRMPKLYFLGYPNLAQKNASAFDVRKDLSISIDANECSKVG